MADDGLHAFFVAHGVNGLREISAQAPSWKFLPGAHLKATLAEGIGLSEGLGEVGVPVLHSVRLDVAPPTTQSDECNVSRERRGPFLCLASTSGPFVIKWKVALMGLQYLARAADSNTLETSGRVESVPTGIIGERLDELGSVTDQAVRAFAKLVGDPSPLHSNRALAHELGFPELVVPGALLACLILLATRNVFVIPGSHTTIRLKRWVFANQLLKFRESDRRSAIVNARGQELVTLRW